MFDRLKKTAVEWIVVFLGNPGPKYAGTRHNAGFIAADVCERKTGEKINRSRFHALTARISVKGAPVLLMKPQTYMNLSGNAVAEAARFYKVPTERILVISDDVSLPVGKVRLRIKGSAGGHNGLKSIIERLGTQDFPRIKIGIGAPEGEASDMIGWVIGSFRNQEAAVVAEAAERAWDAAECYITEGADRAMNKFN